MPILDTALRLFGFRQVVEAAPLTALAIKAAPVRSPTVSVVPDRAIYNQIQRLGGAITPQTVTEIFRRADMGDVRGQCDLANEIRQKDCHLQSILSKAEEAVAGLKWQIVPPKKPTARERKAAEFAQQALDGCQLSRMLAHQAGSIFYGHAVSEIIYKRDGSKLVPSRFEAVAPRRFGYRRGDGAFVFLASDVAGSADSGSVILADQYPGKFIESHPRVTGDVGPREGLIRALTWAALFRNWTLTDWLRLAELAWKPWRTATYALGANQETIDSLQEMLEQAATTGAMVYRDDVKVELKFPEASGSAQSNHGGLFDAMGREMSKAVLGQTETTDSSKSSGYAQAKVGENTEATLLESRARAISDDVTRDLVIPMTKLNFGDIRPGRFVLVTKDTQDLQTFSVGVKNLKDAGLEMPVAWIRDEAGIPEPVDGEEVIGGESEEIENEAADEADAGKGDAKAPDATTQPGVAA